MLTIFNNFSREFENEMFGVIASYIGHNKLDHYGYIRTTYRLSLRSTKRRELARVFVVKRTPHLDIVVRKWLVNWGPNNNLKEF